MFSAYSLRSQACLIIFLPLVTLIIVAELINAMVDALQELQFLAVTLT